VATATDAIAAVQRNRRVVESCDVISVSEESRWVGPGTERIGNKYAHKHTQTHSSLFTVFLFLCLPILLYIQTQPPH